MWWTCFFCIFDSLLTIICSIWCLIQDTSSRICALLKGKGWILFHPNVWVGIPRHPCSQLIALYQKNDVPMFYQPRAGFFSGLSSRWKRNTCSLEECSAQRSLKKVRRRVLSHSFPAYYAVLEALFTGRRCFGTDKVLHWSASLRAFPATTLNTPLWLTRLSSFS